MVEIFNLVGINLFCGACTHERIVYDLVTRGNRRPFWDRGMYGECGDHQIWYSIESPMFVVDTDDTTETCQILEGTT